MDIAAISNIIAQANIKQQAGIQLATKIIDISKQKNIDLLRMIEGSSSLENSVTPHIGGNIDIKL